MSEPPKASDASISKVTLVVFVPLGGGLGLAPHRGKTRPARNVGRVAFRASWPRPPAANSDIGREEIIIPDVASVLNEGGGNRPIVARAASDGRRGKSPAVVEML
jgi:hypothetical protein